MRGGEPNWPGADDRNFVRQRRLFFYGVGLEIFGFGAVAFSQEALERANLDWFVDFTAAAGAFTGMGANASADAGQGIGIAREAVSFFKPAFRNQRHVTPGIGVRRTSHHAGKIGIQPIPAYRFVLKPLLHDVLAPALGFSGTAEAVPHTSLTAV